MARQRYAIFDLDGTLTRHDTFARFLAGLLLRTPSRWIRIPQLAYWYARLKAGSADNGLVKERFLTLLAGGVPPAVLEDRARELADRVVSQWLRPAMAERLARERDLGAHLVLATASPDIYVNFIGQRLGFETVICTLTRRDPSGASTGRLDGGNCYGPEKLGRVRAHAAGLGDGLHTVVYTDHHSDLPLLEWADEPHAVNPTAALREACVQRGYAILDTEGER